MKLMVTITGKPVARPSAFDQELRLTDLMMTAFVLVWHQVAFGQLGFGDKAEGNDE